MWWQAFKSVSVFLIIVLCFILLLLLPREKEITHHSGLVFTADYPFSFDLYKERIHEFIDYFQIEKGFGETRTGVPIVEEVQKLLGRSLKIILPAFFVSIILGTLLGILQFSFRNRIIGRIQAFFSWVFSSIPDFFLYIAIQYLLIKLLQAGFPKFSLYGDEHWYSFIIPLLAVTLFPMIHMVKYTVTTLENEVGQEYLQTARAKGLRSPRILLHMLWNCWHALLNQTQFVMLYILSSLPIIEKLSNYRGAGYHLLESIFKNEDASALALMLPFLILMFMIIYFSNMIKLWLVPQKGGGLR